MNHTWRKYLLLLPIVLLVINALYFQYATQEIQNAMLRQKQLEVTDAVDMLAAAVEANPERSWQDHEENIVESTEFLDNLHMIYAVTFKHDGDGLERISCRNFETDFDPLEYPKFLDVVLSNESGSITIGFTPDGMPYRDLHIYYRWMPIYSSESERYLVAVGVSVFSIVTKVPALVSIGQWISMAATFVLNVWMITLLVRLGYIYEVRKGDKWRDRRR